MIDNYGIINERAPHLIADVCEIISYFENREVSLSDIEKVIAEKGSQSLLAELEEAESTAEVNEKHQKLAEETMRHLQYRQVACGDWYPFEVMGDVLAPHKTVTVKHKTYAALLGFSRLKMFKPVEITAFAADFEKLCTEAAEAFAAGWEVVHFGAGGRDRGAYGTKLKDSLRALAVTLRETPQEHVINELKENNTGDGGIDIVIYKKWSDPARAVPAYLGQCAAQQNAWPEKRLEASPVVLSKYFSFFHAPGTILFIPICHRNVDGTWVDHSGYPAIVIDRVRLLQLLDNRIQSVGNAGTVFRAFNRPFDMGCAVGEG